MCLTFLQFESPRFLIKNGKDSQALEVMSRLRKLPADHPYVQEEIGAILMQHQEEMEATMGASWYGSEYIQSRRASRTAHAHKVSFSGSIGSDMPEERADTIVMLVMKELLFVPSNLYRLGLALGAQFMSQWSGAGSITLYAPDLFSLLGITGTSEGLLVTAVFGVVKLVAAVGCALFLVDVIGRKRSLLTGIVLQAIAMVYVASFLTAVPELGVVEDYVLSPAETGPSKGAIFMIYLSGFGWALGWNSMQYLLTAELFPLRIRALATSMAMTLHFANQYGNARAVPNMLLSSQNGVRTVSPLIFQHPLISFYSELFLRMPLNIPGAKHDGNHPLT